MKYLICYDITETRLRTRVAKLLQYFGLNRLQFSVFGGEINNKHLKRLEEKLENLMLEKDKDSIIILPLSKQYTELYSTSMKSIFDEEKVIII